MVAVCCAAPPGLIWMSLAWTRERRKRGLVHTIEAWGTAARWPWRRTERIMAAVAHRLAPMQIVWTGGLTLSESCRRWAKAFVSNPIASPGVPTRHRLRLSIEKRLALVIGRIPR